MSIKLSSTMSMIMKWAWDKKAAFGTGRDYSPPTPNNSFKIAIMKQILRIQIWCEGDPFVRVYSQEHPIATHHHLSEPNPP